MYNCCTPGILTCQSGCILVRAGNADQVEVVDGTLLAELQDGVRYMVMEGAQHPVSQALPLSNDQALHEHIQGFLIQPFPQQTHPLQG